MNQATSLLTLARESVYEKVANALAVSGWGILSDVLDSALVNALREHALTDVSFRQAAIGRDLQRQVNRSVRGDRISWIDGATGAERQWLLWCELLREYLNRSLMLNLVEFESHFAHYPPGAGYRRHVDAFKGSRSRLISMVLYLNPDWQSGDGGELALYDDAGIEIGCFAPRMAQLAFFLSEGFPHEVRCTRDHRYSIAGWFRCRPELPVSVIID